MKRFVAFLLTLIMLLSAATLTTASAEGQGSYPVAENVKGRKITVDGLMGEREGWSKDPMFQTHLAVRELLALDKEHREIYMRCPTKR